MALSLSNAASGLNRSAQGILQADMTAAGVPRTGSFAPTIAGNAGTTRVGAPSTSGIDQTVPGTTSVVNGYGGILSQLPGARGNVGTTFAPGATTSFTGPAALPTDRGPDMTGGIIDSKVAMGAKVPDRFTGFEGESLNPRATGLPGGGQAPGDRTQPSVTNDWYTDIVNQDFGGGGFTDMYGNPVDARSGLPNGGVVPEGRANPADAITPGGFSPVLSSTGSQYRQAGSPVMGNIEYSTQMVPNEVFSPEIASNPFTGQPAQPPPTFTDPMNGQPTGGRTGLPSAPTGRGLPTTSNPLAPTFAPGAGSF